MMPSVWTIGDIHGEHQLLSRLLDHLPRQAHDYTVFLGDYIDRGPDSKQAVARVLQEQESAPDRTVLLWGNHEDLAAEHWKLPRPSSYAYDAYDWFRNGGSETMQSYGYEKPELFVAACPEELCRLFPLLQTFWRAPATVFPELAHVIWVHAGIPPGSMPEDETGDTLLWIRQEFLEAYDPSGRLVIHGHTPVSDVRVLPDKIGIDTGAVYGRLLTALRMPERVIYQIDAATRQIRQRAL